MFKRRARQFELACGFEADRAVAARQRDHLAALDHRFPTEAGERHEQVADAAGLVVRGGAVVARPIDELLVLGPDAPGLARFFPLDHGRRELVAAFDDGIVLIRNRSRRSEEHTSELQSLMRISYAVF